MSKRRELMKHQAKALLYTHQRQNSALFMKMRMGKTLVIVRYASQLGLNRKLVVAPSWVTHSWAHELSLEGQSHTRIDGSPLQRLEKLKKGWSSLYGTWFIITPESLRCSPELVKLPWDMVVIDESTCIKNPKAKITKLCCESFRGVPHRVILSGEPAPEGPLDLFCQFKFLRGGFMGYKNYWEFRSALFQPDFTGYGWVPKPGVLMEINNAVRELAFCMTHAEAGMEIKPVHESLMIDLPPEMCKLYADSEKNFTLLDKETVWSVVLDCWLGRLAGGFDADGNLIWDGKLRALLRLLQGELKGESVVVWFRFTAEIKCAYKMLTEAGLTCYMVKGGMKKSEQSEVLDKFRVGQDKGNILLAQVKCGKGLDFSAANTAVYYSHTHSREEREQSEFRIVNPKKQIAPLYVDMVTRGTVDEDIIELQADKALSAKLVTNKMMQRVFRRVNICANTTSR